MRNNFTLHTLFFNLVVGAAFVALTFCVIALAYLLAGAVTYVLGGGK